MSKKKDKRLAHANMVWKREQLQAAMAAERVDKALAAVEQYQSELSDEDIEKIRLQAVQQRSEIEAFLLKARNKYANKLDELNLEAVVQDRMDNGNFVLVNIEDL
ncbi:hypothetical protein UFOVP45_140 [uncultured Caudovirales phage]|uniref:Uncharacterized protein n=1 Tax=uncultured Caudovirales phage TaxID=2100421 RepID=A0A6J5KVI0_9CAUD|nr:hypothetical protein UFOVP45_140 [uncultured Caudovirales phage]